ncbi:hypothetical protein ACSS6N_14945 [Peribacillus frigoritolerans]|uniref:hypothetical protein n=1 Tax=Peribacillus frigoritolerans TaxID=450367 RepID=UPI003F841973
MEKNMQRPSINTPISIITDLDVKPWIYYEFENKLKPVYSILDEQELRMVLRLCEEQLDDVIYENIGIEYSTINKLAADFGFTLTKKNKETILAIAQKIFQNNISLHWNIKKILISKKNIQIMMQT